MIKALLVIDVQEGVYRWGEDEVLGGADVVCTINSLIASARAAGAPVVFVQHTDEDLVAGTPAFELLGDLDVRAGDVRITKSHGSAFHDTDLRHRLQELSVDTLVVCGMQSEYCVDSTVRHAVVLGYGVELVADAHTTFDSDVLDAARIIAHHNRVLGGYVTVAPARDIEF
jgi:nicotinamidase-related amidase